MSGSIAFSHELGELALEAGDSPFELVHAVAKRVDLALDELSSAIAHPLIDLCGGLLERLTRESIIEHIQSSGTGRKGTRSIHTITVRCIVAWMPKRTPTRWAVPPIDCTFWRRAARIMTNPALG
jgi:hypothetical protein